MIPSSPQWDLVPPVGNNEPKTIRISLSRYSIDGIYFRLDLLFPTSAVCNDDRNSPRFFVMNLHCNNLLLPAGCMGA